MTTIVEYERRKNELRVAMQQEKERHEKSISTLRFEFSEADNAINNIVSGLDEERLLLAEHVIYVSGLYANAGDEKATALEDIIQNLLKGGGRLWGEYVGTKSYDRWYGQHTSHGYGYGPRHGSMIFCVGLLEPIRKRQGDEKRLSDEEIDAAIYYLRNLPKIQEAKASAIAAAKAI